MSDSSDLFDATVASLSTKIGMGGGTATSIFGCLTHSEALVVIGIITTLGGFILNWIFQRRRDKRSKELYDLRKQVLEAQLKDIQKNADSDSSNSR